MLETLVILAFLAYGLLRILAEPRGLETAAQPDELTRF